MSAVKQITDEDLKAQALRLGARVVLSDGRVFNAEGRVGTYKAKAPKLLTPPQPIEPPGNDRLEKLLQALLVQMAKEPPVMPEIPAPVVTVQPAPPANVVVNAAPVSWKFTFDRNESGTIRSITATPVKE